MTRTTRSTRIKAISTEARRNGYKLVRCDAPQATPVKARTPKQAAKTAVKRTVKDPQGWRKNAPSARQMERINVAYGALGWNTFANRAQFLAVFPTAGEASDEFQRPVVKAAYYSAR
jgi:hypothetical protein